MSLAPRISVITTFLNASRFIEETIDSVMSQTWSDFELLLVDDGSTDASVGIAKDLAAQHPGKVFYLEHDGHVNRGMSASRNLGLAAARGEFVAFIDADDVWRPQKLAEQLRLIEAHPGVGMVCGTVRYWRSWEGGCDEILHTGHAVNAVVQPPEASLALYPLGFATPPCPSDIFWRRSAVLAVGGFEEHFVGPLQMYEDQALLAKFYLAYPVYFSDAIWLDYRQHADSCVAVVTRTGQYRAVRLYFLEWFETYLRTSQDACWPDVQRALHRALLFYRRPTVAKIFALSKRLAKKARSIFAGIRSRGHASRARNRRL